MIGQLLLSIILFSKWWSAWTALQVRLHTPIKERRSGTVQTQPCPYGVVAEELSEFRGTREARARAAIWRWQWLPIISGITRSTRDWMLESCSCCHLCQVGLIIPYLLCRARASPWQTLGESSGLWKVLSAWTWRRSGSRTVLQNVTVQRRLCHKKFLKLRFSRFHFGYLKNISSGTQI